MCIAPHAETNDGLLELVVLGDYSRAAAIGLSKAIYSGAHLGRPKTRTVRGKRFKFDWSKEAPLSETWSSWTAKCSRTPRR